jgi:type IV secretion system protein VirB4
MTKEKNRKSDNTLFKSDSSIYMPIACHYDESTLLTKNGELIQTIIINGINSEQISDNLMNLRDMVRQAIRENIKTEKFAFWIHTVRKKTNLDDNTPYSKFFSANLHGIWKQKNYWHDKFVNSLYITVVYSAADLQVKGLRAFLSAMNFSITKKFHESFLEQAHRALNIATNLMVESLKEFGAKKLSIIYDKEGCFSELLFLYGRIVHLYESKIDLPCQDLSEALASCKYAVGSDVIEVIDEESKKFASMIALKEYQEIGTEELDRFLQLPIEMIVSEIFYFLPKEQALEQVKYQDYILKVSNDDELRKWKGVENIVEEEEINAFCNQQITITIIGEHINQLEQDTSKVAKSLSALGIMHVREDIGLEQAFWAQLPGNFHYLKRLNPALTRNIASMASLHNTPTGGQENKWGKFITLFRTEKGTPYFMNFHHDAASSGHTSIFGGSKIGKTVLTNFLLSEATKFNPTILYLNEDNNSEILINALEGKWREVKFGESFLNPFIVDNTESNKKYIKDIIHILFGNNEPSNQNNIKLEENIVEWIFNQPLENRTLENLYNGFDFSSLNAENYRERLAKIMNEKQIISLLNNNDENIELNKVQAFNLKQYTEKDFETKNYPSDPKQRAQYAGKISILNKVRDIMVVSLINKLLNLDKKTPKILIIDNLFSLLSLNSLNILHDLLDAINDTNGILLATINIEDHEKLLKLPQWKSFYNKLATKIILPSEVVLDEIDQLLELSPVQIKKLKTLKPNKRLFIIKQLENTIVTELSLGGLPGVLKMLSASEEDIKVVHSIIEQKGSNPEEWLEEVYEILNK